MSSAAPLDPAPLRALETTLAAIEVRIELLERLADRLEARFGACSDDTRHR